MERHVRRQFSNLLVSFGHFRLSPSVMAKVVPVTAGPPNCYGPNVKENARTPGSFVTSVSTWRRRAAPATRRIMPDRSKCATPSGADVGTAGVPDGLPVQQHGHRRGARGSRLHDQVHFAGSEGKHDLACALPELDVLTFGSPVALEGDATGLASVSSDIRLIRDPA